MNMQPLTTTELREWIHRLYECRLEADKMLVMIERYEAECKRRYLSLAEEA